MNREQVKAAGEAHSDAWPSADGQRPASRHVAWIAPVLFLAGFLVLTLLSRPELFLHGHVLPVGDAAADDLLVYRAKFFRLLTGNYSRVGFNHPGPFFMQVAALGELVFYDWLHLFKSYYAAEVFGLATMQGLALAMALRLWLIISKDLLPSVSAILISIAIISVSWQRNIFVNEWPPHSYIAGAVALTAGLTGLWVRGVRWAPLAAVGTVSLVHGHASFIGLVPLMLMVFFVLLAARHRRLLRDTPRLLLDSVRQAPLSWAATLLIFALGALPIVADMLKQWPGEFGSYFSFAHQSQTHGARAALLYVWSYVPLAGVWFLLFLIPPRGPAAGALKELRLASLAVFLAGLAGALFYAHRGVDDFSFRYLILWFAVFVGATAGGATICALAGVRTAWIKPMVLLLSAALCWSSLHDKILDPIDAAESAAVERATARILQSTPKGERIALSLDTGADWVPVWTETAGIVASLQRHGSDAVCIADGWHILFTREYRCGPNDRIARRYFVEMTNGAAQSPAIPFYKTGAFGSASLLGQAAPPGKFEAAGVRLVHDWSQSEGGWVWSDGPHPSLTIDVHDLAPRQTVTLRGMVFSDGHTPQTVTLRGPSGQVLATASALSGDVALSAPVDLAAAAPGAILNLDLDIGRPLSPKSIGASADTRQLGFAIKSIQLSPVRGDH